MAACGDGSEMVQEIKIGEDFTELSLVLQWSFSI